jgi:hypothetical protein
MFLVAGARKVKMVTNRQDSTGRFDRDRSAALTRTSQYAWAISIQERFTLTNLGSQSCEKLVVWTTIRTGERQQNFEAMSNATQ